MSDGNDYLLFVWSPAGYAVREEHGDLPQIGSELEVDERMLVVTKVGTSPFPGDTRRCVFVSGK